MPLTNSEKRRELELLRRKYTNSTQQGEEFDISSLYINSPLEPTRMTEAPISSPAGEVKRVAPNYVQASENAMGAIDEFFGVGKSPYDNTPMTPSQQSFEDMSPTSQVLSTAGRGASRAIVGALSFIPSLYEKTFSTLFSSGENGSKSKLSDNALAFFDEMQLIGGIVKRFAETGIVVGEEGKAMLDLIIDVPAQLQYIIAKAVGKKDPYKNFNENDPFVKMMQGITGKSFEDYYKDAVNNMYNAPESPIFGALLGKGGFEAVSKKGKTPTVSEQVKEGIEPTPYIPESFETKISDNIMLDSKLNESLKAPDVNKTVKLESDKKPKDVSVPATDIPIEPKSPAVEPIVEPFKSDPFAISDIGLGRVNEPKLFNPLEVEKPKPIEPAGEQNIGLSMAEIDYIRDNTKLSELPQSEKQSWAGHLQQAKYDGIPEKAFEIASEVFEFNRTLTPTEHAGFVLKVAELNRDYQGKMKAVSDALDAQKIAEAERLTTEGNYLAKQIDLLTEAADISGSEAGRVLNIRKMLINAETFDLASVTRKAKARAGRGLSMKEGKEFQELTERYAKLEAELNELQKNFQETLKEKERLLAESIVEKTARRNKVRKAISTKTAKSKERVKIERADVLKKLEGLGWRVNDITGATTESLILIGKLANTYMKESIINLVDLTKKIKNDLPEVSDLDIYRAITFKDPKKIKKAKSELQKQMAINKRMADLFVQIEDAANGIFREPKKRSEQVAEVVELRNILKKMKDENKRRIDDLSGATAKKIADRERAKELRKLKKQEQTIKRLEEQIEGQYRDIKKQKGEDSPASQRNKDKIKELRKKMRELDVAEDLREQIREAKEGVFRETRKSQPAPEEIQNLRKELSELKRNFYQATTDANALTRALERVTKLQEQLDGHYRSIKAKRKIPSEEMQATLDKIKELKTEMRLTDKILDMKEQLRTGEIKMPKPKVEVPVPESIQRKMAEINILKREIRGKVDELAPTTPKKIVGEVVNTLRTLKATADMSYTFRQGLLLSASRPVLAGKAFAGAFKAAFNEMTAEQIDASIKSADWHYKRENAGLHLSEIGGKLTQREEMFMSRLTEKIPVLKQIVRASDRHMTTGLNLLRVGVFDEFLKKHPNATNLELKALADYINVASGRGNLGKFAQSGEVLGTVFFAPRFAVSRFQAPWKLKQNLKNPRVRNVIAKDLAAVGGLGLSVLTLADLAGFSVTYDTRSSDFGKVRFGDTRVDLFGGFLQPMRLLLRPIVGVTDMAGISGKELVDSEKEIDPYELLERFVAGKTSPLVSLSRELYTGKDFIGRTPELDIPFLPKIEGRYATIAKSLLPIVMEDVLDGYHSDGLLGAGVSSAFNTFGINAQTYTDGYAATRKKIRELQKDPKNDDEVAQIKEQWNIEHPQGPRIVNVKSFEEERIAKKMKEILLIYEVDKEEALRMREELKAKYPNETVPRIKVKKKVRKQTKKRK